MIDLKKDFPVFSNNKWLVYLDNWATTQKPSLVVQGVSEYLEKDYANIHRWFYELSERSEEIYERSKKIVAQAIWGKASEIIYTYNSTYAFNILATTLVRSWILKKWDKILLTVAEHHANIVPWLILNQDYGIEIDYIWVTKDYEFDFDDFNSKYDKSVKLVSATWVSNVTGSVFDMKKIKSLLREDTLFSIDASQAVPNFKIDVEDIWCDFLAFTGHKLMAFTWIWVLWIKRDLIKKLIPPIWWWGSIKDVTKQGVEFLTTAQWFEPWTPNLVWAVSLLKAFEYIESIWWYDEVQKREKELVKYALWKFAGINDRVEIIWTLDESRRLWVFSFLIKWDMKPLRVGEYMASKWVCVRCGWHCAHPFMKQLELSGTCRMSLYFYNDFSDIDRFFEVLNELI